MLVEIPQVSAGTIIGTACRDLDGEWSENGCQLEPSNTLLIPDLEDFCDTDAQYCSIMLANFTNSGYATPEPHASLDSFKVSLQYVNSAGQTILVHQSSENIFAHPMLAPKQISIETAEFSPNPS